MTHPCDGHVCDHCAICQAGYCCGSVTSEQRAQLEAAASYPVDERLRAAVEQELGRQPSIAELVRRDAAQPAPAVLLLAPSSVPEPTESGAAGRGHRAGSTVAGGPVCGDSR